MNTRRTAAIILCNPARSRPAREPSTSADRRTSQSKVPYRQDQVTLEKINVSIAIVDARSEPQLQTLLEFGFR
jgi:hypothetical protein